MSKKSIGILSVIERQDRSYNKIHKLYEEAKERVENAKTRNQKNMALKNFLPLQQQFIRNRQEAIPTELWQIIASMLTVKDRLTLSRVDKHLHDQVVFGLYAPVFVWKHDMNEIVRVFDDDMFRNFDMLPIYFACEINNVLMLRMLLEAKADIDQVDVFFRTPLFFASSMGHVDIVEVLIHAGSDSNKANENGLTPLYTAVYHNHIKVVETLLKAGCDVNKAENRGETPLWDACSYRNIEIVKILLLHGADMNQPNEDGFTPLNNACRCGFPDVVEVLLEAGADINQPNNQNETPLITACTNSYDGNYCDVEVIERVEIVSMLLDAKADITLGVHLLRVCDNNGYELSRDHVDMIVELLEAGVDVNCSDGDGNTALLEACRNNQCNIVEILLEAGADVNQSNSGGQTPLLVASMCNNVPLAEILMEAGAS